MALAAADSPRLRLRILGIVAISLFAALFARLWYLQVIGIEEYQVETDVIHTREIHTEAPRGRVLDARGRVIVDNRTSIVVLVDRQLWVEHDSPQVSVIRLAEELTRRGDRTKAADLLERVSDPQYGPLEPVPILVDIDEDLEIYLMERQDEFPVLSVRREAVRVYPYGQTAAHVLGYVGRITQDEFDAKMSGPGELEKPYELNDTIGKTGVERVYEDWLRGVPGVQTIEVTPAGEPIRTLSSTPPQPGSDVQLTIDIDVQAMVESELLRGLETARATPPRDGRQPNLAPAGAAVVLDPRNGDVIALASYPTYAPAEFVNGISTERYAELIGDDAADDPFTNRAIAGQYAPGSTFKLVTGFAGLAEDLIEPESSFYDGGDYTAQGCAVGREACTYNSPGAAGVVNVQSALTASSDVFFYWLGDRFWSEAGRDPEGIQKAAEEFGLHAATGIPLPFEASGYIPTAERRLDRHEESPEAFPNPDWYSGDNIITAIGQGDVLVTPLQLANVYATFANQGTLHQPNIAARVLLPEGDPEDPADLLREFEPRVAREIDFPKKWWEPMHAGFRGVTSALNGTASSVFRGWDQFAWPVAGKTGTAEVQGRADTSLFVGFGPAYAPEYVVAVVLEQSGFGADAAAPVVRRIFEPLAGNVQLPRAVRQGDVELPPVTPPDTDDEQPPAGETP